MKEQDNVLFEAELRRLKPGKLPGALESHLAAALDRAKKQETNRPPLHVKPPAWWFWMRWLAPATVVALAFLLVMTQANRPLPAESTATDNAGSSLKADKVKIDRKLLASFDTVASLPDGEPIRFHCREWVDAVTLRDSATGVEIVRRTPRIEVIPVSFETF